MSSTLKLESLDTTYVNLGALLRHLRQRNFVGRVKVVLDEYEADVFLHGSEEPGVWESNHSTGRRAQGKEAMERLLVRAREPGGLITIYQGTEEAGSIGEMRNAAARAPENIERHKSSSARLSADSNGGPMPPVEEVNWADLLDASGQLIAAVERAVRSSGEDFTACLRYARIELGDDYPFIDPTLGGFQYADSKVQLREHPPASVFISSLTECLRRIVSKLAAGKEGARFRERVAVELAVAARRKENALAEFTPQLDRIAGTRVL